MKQTQEMIKAKAEQCYPLISTEYEYEYANENAMQRHLRQAFVNGAEFMQAQQEESEAGDSIIHNLDFIHLGCCTKCGGVSFRQSECDEWRKHRASLPAPVIESPPMRKNPKLEERRKHISQEAKDMVDKHFAELAPSSVEEKGEGELSELEKEYKALIDAEYEEAVSFAAVHGWKSSRYEKGKELRGKIAALKSADKHYDPKLMANQYTMPAPPSVKEEDAEGVMRSIPILRQYENTGVGIAIVNAMKEYAARDYKSAKGIKLPNDNWIKDRMLIGVDGFAQTNIRFGITETINEIRRLNDPQGEGR